MVAKKKKAKEQKLLTEVETELMNIIWGLGNCTVKDVQAALPPNRDLAYTSVATIMKILEQKKFLKSEKYDKAHIYKPLRDRGEYEALSLKHLSENLFQGNPSSMVMRLLDSNDLSEEELKSIRELLESRLNS